MQSSVCSFPDVQNEFVPSDWGRYAVCYDSLLHLRPYLHMLQSVVRVSHSLTPGAILDASCGTGNFEKILTESGGKIREVVGIDSSVPMLTRAREKCGHIPHFSFQNADLDAPLPFKNETFAHVISLNTLYAVKNPMVTVQEFHRVLKKGGNIVLVTPKRGYENGLILKEHCGSLLPDAYWEDVHASAAREQKLIYEAIDDVSVAQDMIEVAAYNRSIAHDRAFHFFDPTDLLTLLETVGFSIKQVADTYAHQDMFVIAQKGV